MRKIAFLCLLSACTLACGQPNPGPATRGGGSSSPETEARETSCSIPSGALYTEEHFIASSSGAVLHIVERYSDLSLWQPRPRAILLLTATLATNVQYDARVPGDDSYNALDRLAKAGFHAYALTYEGYGLSSLPSHGAVVTAERLLVQAGDILLWIRDRTGASRVDIMGSSIGSSLAVALGGQGSPVPLHSVGRLVLTSLVHRSVSELMEALLFSPETRAMLEGAPDGYVSIPPEAYFILLSEATPDAAAWAYATFPDVYAVGPTLEGFTLPVVDASAGRRPALQFWGSLDLVTPFGDALQFQEDYGGPVGLAVLEGGGHGPFFEPVREEFWSRTLFYLWFPWPLSLPLSATWR